jgi:hypothetical protein
MSAHLSHKCYCEAFFLMIIRYMRFFSFRFECGTSPRTITVAATRPDNGTNVAAVKGTQVLVYWTKLALSTSCTARGCVQNPRSVRPRVTCSCCADV